MNDTVTNSITEAIDQAIDMIKSENQDKILEGVTRIRVLLSAETNPPIDPVLNAGGLPLLVDCLKREDNPRIQFEAVWAITNIASGTSEDTLEVIKSGAVSHFIDLLDSDEMDIREQTVWALGNIAGDSPDSRDLVLQLDVLPKLVNIICERHDGQDTSLVRNTTWALSNLCRGKPQPDFDLVKPCLPALVHLITNFMDEEIVTDASWTLSYLTDGADEKIQLVVSSGIVKDIVNLLSHWNYNIVTPILRTVGNIVTGNDHCTQVVLDEGVVTRLAIMLDSSKKGIRKEACWTISNITAGNRSHIQYVIDGRLIPKLVNMAVNEHDPEVQRESLWALGNSCSGGSFVQIAYFVRCGIIPALFLGLKEKNVNSIKVSLEALENILEAGENQRESEEINVYVVLVEESGCLSLIEQHRRNRDHDVSELSVKLLETYFKLQSNLNGHDQVSTDMNKKK